MEPLRQHYEQCHYYNWRYSSEGGADRIWNTQVHWCSGYPQFIMNNIKYRRQDFTWCSGILRDQAEGHLLHQMNYIVAQVDIPSGVQTNIESGMGWTSGLARWHKLSSADTTSARKIYVMQSESWQAMLAVLLELWGWHCDEATLDYEVLLRGLSWRGYRLMGALMQRLSSVYKDQWLDTWTDFTWHSGYPQRSSWGVPTASRWTI